MRRRVGRSSPRCLWTNDSRAHPYDHRLSPSEVTCLEHKQAEHEWRFMLALADEENEASGDTPPHLFLPVAGEAGVRSRLSCLPSSITATDHTPPNAARPLPRLQPGAPLLPPLRRVHGPLGAQVPPARPPRLTRRDQAAQEARAVLARGAGVGRRARGEEGLDGRRRHEVVLCRGEGRVQVRSTSAVCSS